MAKAKTKDYFKELKKAPYPLFTAPKPYSFDLNEDMVDMLRTEFEAEVVADKLAAAIKGKSKADVEKAARVFFTDHGKAWMQKTIQLGEEYSDRTIEVILESVDRQGNQFMLWPHVPQRFVEIAYLGTQNFLKVPIILNNMEVLAYRIPQCALYAAIGEKCGKNVAKMMTCSEYCMTALDTVRKHVEMEMLNEQVASTAKDGYCEFYMRKL
jgi:hypothetical protein